MLMKIINDESNNDHDSNGAGDNDRDDNGGGNYGDNEDWYSWTQATWIYNVLKLYLKYKDSLK